MDTTSSSLGAQRPALHRVAQARFTIDAINKEGRYAGKVCKILEAAIVQLAANLPLAAIIHPCQLLWM